MLKSFFAPARPSEAVATVWTADWRDSIQITKAALDYWTHPDRNVVRVGMKPNARGRMRPAYFATVAVFDIRSDSAQMGPRIIERNAMGDKHCQAVVAEWGKNRLRARFADINPEDINRVTYEYETMHDGWED